MASQHACRGHAMSIRAPNAHPQSSISNRFVHRSKSNRKILTRRHVSSERDMGEESGSSFHQQRMKTTAKKDDANKPPIAQDVCVRIVESDDDIECVSWLRATSFYAYPEERKFAGKIHQLMIAEEESKSLKALRLDRRLRSEDPISSSPRDGDTVTLMASCHADSIPGIDEKLCYLESTNGSQMAVLGSLDIHAARALPGEVLIGSSDNAAYLANVCTASAARRRGVATALLSRAREIAQTWNVDALFVHTMAVNEIAIEFYTKNGFVIDKEETSNQAHYRGRCLDGIEGRGRTVLLRDTTLN